MTSYTQLVGTDHHRQPAYQRTLVTGTAAAVIIRNLAEEETPPNLHHHYQKKCNRKSLACDTQIFLEGKYKYLTQLW